MNRQQRSTEEMAEAVRRCFDAYGGDVSAWPEDKRAVYGEMAQSDAFAELREEAVSLDAFLNAATMRAPRHDLKNRIMAQIDLPSAQPRSGGLGLLTMLLRPFPAGALAGVGALGLATGFLTANVTSASTPEYEAYAYLEAADGFFDEEEVLQWDAD